MCNSYVIVWFVCAWGFVHMSSSVRDGYVRWMSIDGMCLLVDVE